MSAVENFVAREQPKTFSRCGVFQCVAQPFTECSCVLWRTLLNALPHLDL